MPSPGIATLKTELAIPFVVEGGFNTSIALESEFNNRLCTALHNGWTSATPTTPTQMEAQINLSFSDYVQSSGPFGTGWQHILCLGKGIDEEIDAWVASWDSGLMQHTFIVTAASIETRILNCYPFTSNALLALASAVSLTFEKYFVQEVG